MADEYNTFIYCHSKIISTAWSKIKDILKEEAVNPNDLDMMFMFIEIKTNEKQYTSFKELQDDISHTLLQNAENFNNLTSAVQSVDGIIQQMTPTKRATTFHCPICQIEMFTLKEMMSHIEKCTSTSTSTCQEQSQQSSSQSQLTPPPPTQKPHKNTIVIEEKKNDDEDDEYDGESVVYSQLYPNNNNKSNKNTQNDDFPTYSLDLQPQLQQQSPQPQNNNNPESETTQTPSSTPPKQLESNNNNNNNLVFTSTSTVNSLVKRQLFNTNDNSSGSNDDASSEDEENNKFAQSPPIKTKSQQFLSNNITPLKNKSFTIPIISQSPSSSLTTTTTTTTTPNKTFKEKRNNKKNQNINSQLTPSPLSKKNNNSPLQLSSPIHNQNMNNSQLSTQSTMINISTPSPPPHINRQPTIIENSPNSYKQPINYSMPLNFFLVPPSVKRRKLDGCETQKITREYKDYDENGNEVDIEEYIEIKIVRKIKQPN